MCMAGNIFDTPLVFESRTVYEGEKKANSGENELRATAKRAGCCSDTFSVKS